MPHAYTEDQLVEQPAIGLFAELGWTTVSAVEETFGATGTLLRETKGEVVLVSRLRAALELPPVKPNRCKEGSQEGDLLPLAFLREIRCELFFLLLRPEFSSGWVFFRRFTRPSDSGSF